MHPVSVPVPLLAVVRAGRPVLFALLALASSATASASQRPTLVEPEAARRLAALLADNPALAARRAAVALAEARAGAAGLAPVATLEAEAEEVPDGINLLDAGSLRVGVSRELLPSAARRAERDVARQDVARARLEVALTEQSLAARAEAQLVRAAAATAVGRRLAAEDSLLAAAEEALRARFGVGDARYVDVLRLRSERLRVQGDRSHALTDARLARRALLTLTGATEPQAVAEVDALAAVQDARGGALPPAPDVDSLAQLAGAVRLADADIARAEAARRLVTARQRPSVVASVGVQRFERESGYGFGPTLGASVTLPFTARGATRAAGAVAEREVVVAQASRRSAAALVRGEIAAAVERYEAARAQIALYDVALLRAAREEREGALASYRAGDLTLVELLDFERALARAEIDRLRNRMDAADALADVIASVAGVVDDVHVPSAIRRGEDR